MNRPSPDQYVCSTPGTGEIPVWVLRDKFLELQAAGEVNAYMVAVRMGWSEKKRKRNGRTHRTPDAHRVNRVLGLCLQDPGHGQPPKLREHVRYEMAVGLWEAMGLDPVDSDGWL